jgi:hypothetical protein
MGLLFAKFYNNANDIPNTISIKYRSKTYHLSAIDDSKINIPEFPDIEFTFIQKTATSYIQLVFNDKDNLITNINYPVLRFTIFKSNTDSVGKNNVMYPLTNTIESIELNVHYEGYISLKNTEPVYQYMKCIN